MISYEDLSQIPLNSIVKFTEYTLDRHEKKHVNLQITGKLFGILQPNEALSSELIQLYYGIEDENKFPVLSCSSFTRLVVITGVDEYDRTQYQVIEPNKYYMMVGLHELSYDESVEPEISSPNHILGFNSYDIGRKFKE